MGRGPGGPGGGGRGATATTVGIALAGQADIPVLIEALGTVTPVANGTLRRQVSGVLTRVLFKEGLMLKKGDLLATIARESFQMAVAQALGARVRDEAQLEAAQVTLARFRTLLTQDSIARQDVDTQAALVKQLEGTVTLYRANEGSAKLSLGYSRITVPVGGRIGLRPLDAGNYIAAGDANGVAVITQLAPIDVAFSLPQDRVPEAQARVAEGATPPVTAFDRSRLRRLDAGRFSTLDNLVDTTTGTVKAKARFPNFHDTAHPPPDHGRLPHQRREQPVSEPVRQCAAAAAHDQQLLNRDKAGPVSYAHVVTAQASALSARRTVSQVAANRQAAAIALIQALGGGRHTPALP